MSATVREITESDFQKEVLEATGRVVVDFWAPWCGPCKMVAPELEKLAAKVDETTRFVKVNVDESPSVAMTYGIMSIPTIAMFEHGNLVTQVVGARGADDLGKAFGLL